MNALRIFKCCREPRSMALALIAVLVCVQAPVALAGHEPVKQSGTAADAALSKKISAYVDCINDHSNDVHQSRSRYLSWIKDPKRGPTGHEQIVYGLYKLNDTADCQAGITHAASLPPSMPEIEHAATTWINALAALVAVDNEANTYYDLKDYKDDDMRKGKALHPQLMQAFDRFEAANDALYAQVVAIKDGLDQRRLQRLAADPAHHAAYLIATLSDRAKKISRFVDTVGTKNFDAKEYANAVSAYEKAYFAIIDYHKQHPDDEREAFDFPVTHPALELLKSAKALARRERDGFHFTTGERMLIEAGSGEMVEGHPKQVIDKFNALIDAMNTWGHR